ncbi:MAG: methyl-accepting chemotaxis protein, partial [Spirochaetota bacterium]|nr:methyl-accepting chemotaxis protein [Spirochaetota bacterium]
VQFNEETIESLNKMLGEEGSNGKSFHGLEASARQLEEVNSFLNNLIDSGKSLDTHLEDVENKMENIKNFTDKIRSVSERTHVLSINASIEAARGGKMAKGFSVIAQGVKKLAEEAKQSTKTIQDMIQDAFSSVHILRESFTEMLNDLTNYVAVSKKELEEIFAGLSDSYLAIAGNIKLISKSSSITSNNLRDIIYYYSQTEDILSQQLSHIKKILDTINEKIQNATSQIETEFPATNRVDIQKQVVFDIMSRLTMDYEKEKIVKAALEQLQVDVKDLDGGAKKDILVPNKTKEIMGEELSDSIVLF